MIVEGVLHRLSISCFFSLAYCARTWAGGHEHHDMHTKIPTMAWRSCITILILPLAELNTTIDISMFRPRRALCYNYVLQ